MFNPELAKDLDKMASKHMRDVERVMKRHGLDFLKTCFTYDGKNTYKMRMKSHVRTDPMGSPDPDQLSMQSIGEQLQ